MDLSAMFNTGNPFMTEMGTQAVQANQAKAQQDLLTAQGQEQRAQAMAPLEQAHSRATTGYNQALTDQMNDKMAAQPPAADRLKEAMLKMHTDGTTLERSQREADMYERGQRASMIKANGGQIPLALLGQIPQEELPMYQGKGLDTTINIVKAFHDTHPKTMEARAKETAAYQRATDVARIIGTSRVDAASIRGKSGSNSPTGMTPDKAIGYWNNLAAQEPDETLRTKYQAEADRNELIALRFKQAAAQARGEQGLDVVKTAAGGIPVNKEQTTLKPTPRPKAKPKPGSSPDNPIILK